MLTPIEKYPKTNNDNVVLDPYICGGDNRRMFTQVVHQIKDGVKVKQLGFIFLGYNSRKWSAVVYTEKGIKTGASGKQTKKEAIAYFERMKF